MKCMQLCSSSRETTPGFRMAESTQNMKLSCIFQEIWKIYEDTESTDKSIGSDEVQTPVVKALEMTEKAIHMVNEVGLFSSNEDIEEVATGEIRYMLLPALSAFFTMKSFQSDRYETIKKGQVHFVDFLKLLKLYGVTQVTIPKIQEDRDSSPSNNQETSGPSPGDPDLLSMANKRQNKIDRFRQQKEMESRLKELHTAVQKDTVDDEVQREYYLMLLKKWIHFSLEELESIEMELPVLEHMAKMKASATNGQPASKTQPEKPKPLFQPFILTKDKLQAQVFGAGYPGLPTYSVEEWFDQQVQAGRLPDPTQAQNLQDTANDPVASGKQKEDEDAEKESKVEKDDPETLQKSREWDEWKDDHRRGWGNRQNMG